MYNNYTETQDFIVDVQRKDRTLRFHTFSLQPGETWRASAGSLPLISVKIGLFHETMWSFPFWRKGVPPNYPSHGWLWFSIKPYQSPVVTAGSSQESPMFHSQYATRETAVSPASPASPGLAASVMGIHRVLNIVEDLIYPDMVIIYLIYPVYTWYGYHSPSGWWFSNMAFIFHNILGIILPIDFHIFQRDWNHQPEIYSGNVVKTMP